MTKLAFQKLQIAFTQYLRDPDHQPVPEGLNPKHLKIYQELLFENLNSLLQNAFPVLYEILAEDDWQHLLKDYFKNHRATTPLFYEIPQEFLRFLAEERTSENDPDFLYELAHYEWVELAMETLDKDMPHGFDPHGDLLNKKIVLSPYVWVLQYHFPVHKINKDFLPKEIEPTYLIIYRDKNDEVNFMQINLLTAKLLSMLQNNDKATAKSALMTIAQELAADDPTPIVQSGMEILHKLWALNIILGTKKL